MQYTCIDSSRAYQKSVDTTNLSNFWRTDGFIFQEKDISYETYAIAESRLIRVNPSVVIRGRSWR